MQNIVQFGNKKFSLFIKKEKIQNEVNRIAKEINKKYFNKIPLFLCILNGSFLFAADLLKKIKIQNIEVDFVKISSYIGTGSNGIHKKLIGIERKDIKNKDIVIIEDIVDSGNTIEFLITMLKEFEPKSISIATLLFKPKAYLKNIKIDFIGIKVPNDFLIGYGLDYNEMGRNLEDIYVEIDG